VFLKPGWTFAPPVPTGRIRNSFTRARNGFGETRRTTATPPPPPPPQLGDVTGSPTPQRKKNQKGEPLEEVVSLDRRAHIVAGFSNDGNGNQTPLKDSAGGTPTRTWGNALLRGQRTARGGGRGRLGGRRKGTGGSRWARGAAQIRGMLGRQGDNRMVGVSQGPPKGGSGKKVDQKFWLSRPGGAPRLHRRP